MHQKLPQEDEMENLKFVSKFIHFRQLFKQELRVSYCLKLNED
jgi:hypothetical protein